MKSLVALIHREYLEHRGAFLFAPALILGVFATIMATGVIFGRFRLDEKFDLIPVLKVFEVGFLAISALWFVYLLAALFFYYADAFSADRRNNAMLFWKSMPVSDFKILGSKMLTGLSLFPALIFAAILVTGVIVFAGAVFSALQLGLSVPSLFAFLGSAANVAGFALIAIPLALLWYAPFFAWVGLLSALFRRWSIPLAFLIPGLAGLAENLLFRGGPEHGYILGYLRDRFQFGSEHLGFEDARMLAAPFDAGAMLMRLLADIDWPQLGGGLAVAALLVYAASEYRRRFVAA